MNQATTPDATAFCPRCEYDVRGLDTPRCPECGNVFTLTVTYAQSLDDERAVAGGLHIIISVLAIITAGIAIESQLNTGFVQPGEQFTDDPVCGQFRVPCRLGSILKIGSRLSFSDQNTGVIHAEAIFLDKTGPLGIRQFRQGVFAFLDIRRFQLNRQQVRIREIPVIMRIFL